MSAFNITPTPNPNSIRIGLEKTISAGPRTFASAEQAEGDPLAKDLFAITGITQVFMLNNFVSVNKEAGAEWSALEPEVAKVLERHLS